jgi:hypothetical protein
MVHTLLVYSRKKRTVELMVSSHQWFLSAELLLDLHPCQPLPNFATVVVSVVKGQAEKHLAPFGYADKLAGKHCWLICCEKKKHCSG